VRLHVFIRANMEPILMAWEDFARVVWTGGEPGVRILRDHAEEMLLAVCEDLKSPQSDAQQSRKSMGKGDDSTQSISVDRASARHAVSRVECGFDLRALVAEYRALRASVLHLWSRAPDVEATVRLEDMTRFNESMDQLLAESIVSYSERVDHSREIFLGILGHDLRTPLHSVALVADMLANHGELSGLTLKMAMQIAVSVREMERMIRDLLDFTGTRLGAKMTISPEPMDLAELSTEIIEEMKMIHPARVFRLAVDGDVKGSWDRARLRQLISNLLGNAVQHGAADSDITLTISAGIKDAIVSVRNFGNPIPKDAQTIIFDPLRRNTDTNLTRPAGSIGLGLYIAREVASAHGGAIQVQSDTTETTFLVRLPRQEDAAMLAMAAH
jgi:signal transduction histidine kinase